MSVTNAITCSGLREAVSEGSRSTATRTTGSPTFSRLSFSAPVSFAITRLPTSRTSATLSLRYGSDILSNFSATEASAVLTAYSAFTPSPVMIPSTSFFTRGS